MLRHIMGMKHIIFIPPTEWQVAQDLTATKGDGSYVAFCGKRSGHYLFTDNDSLAFWGKIIAS